MKSAGKKKAWVDCRPWSKKKVITALESGADAVIVPAGYTREVKSLGRLATVAEDGDLKLGREVVEVGIEGKEDEDRVVELSRGRIVVVSCPNWKVIPLENIVARSGIVLAQVGSFKAARTALGILERGVAGIVIKSGALEEIKRTVELVKRGREKIELQAVKVTAIEELGLGDRVCVDTCTNMMAGEGMLAGNTASAFFLVHAESVSNPYVSPRPFRVNAGGVHAYTLLPDGKSEYLSGLAAGNEVLLVDYRGKTRPAVVGRSKIETRPLLLVKGRKGRREVSLILQNAETIRLVSPAGKPISVAELKKGDQVLACFQAGARHFGIKIKESIAEK